MKKFLTIALLVMALCVVSIAVSAAPTATADFENGVATVTVTPGTTGQTVVLVVDGAELAAIPNTDAPDTLAQKIIYVDQTAGTAGTPVSFNFIPRTAPSGVTYGVDSTVFYSDGTSVGTPVELYTGATYIVTLDPGEGELEEALRTVKVKANDETLVTLPTPSRIGYKFDGWYNGGNIVTDNKINNAIGGNATLTAKWSAYFEYVPTDSEGGLAEGSYTENTDNKVADTGYYTDAEGTPTEHVISVTTAVASNVEGTIAEYGFYIYNRANEKHVVAKGNGTITAGESFYAIAKGIPTNQTTATVYFKPFIKVGEKYLWGEGHGFTVDGLKGEGQGKNLGLAN